MVTTHVKVSKKSSAKFQILSSDRNIQQPNTSGESISRPKSIAGKVVTVMFTFLDKHTKKRTHWAKKFHDKNSKKLYDEFRYQSIVICLHLIKLEYS